MSSLKSRSRKKLTEYPPPPPLEEDDNIPPPPEDDDEIPSPPKEDDETPPPPPNDDEAPSSPPKDITPSPEIKRDDITPSPLSKETKRGERVKKVACIFQKGLRQFVVAPISKRDQLEIGHGPKNQIYYLSTGTSNEFNFEGVYFPTAGIEEQGTMFGRPGWVMKMLSGLTSLWRARLCELMVEISCDSIQQFLNKFMYWFQVSHSAALGGQFWSRPDMKYLRDFAVNFYWNGQEFVQDENIVSQILVNESCLDVPKKTTIGAKELNDVFEKVNALWYRSMKDSMEMSEKNYQELKINNPEKFKKGDEHITKIMRGNMTHYGINAMIGCDESKKEKQEYLECLWQHFSSWDADRKQVDQELKKKQVGDWLIRRGSDPTALTISIKLPTRISHRKWNWNNKNQLWQEEATVKGETPIQAITIVEIVNRLGLKKSSYFHPTY